MNPPLNDILHLFNNHFKKDIDNNFIDALEALLFLSSPNNETFKQTISLNVQYSSTVESSLDNILLPINDDEDDNDIGKYHNSLHGLNRLHSNDDLKNFKSKEKMHHISVDYNPVDFLICKLTENCRRLYAANKEQIRTKPLTANNTLKNISNYYAQSLKSPHCSQSSAPTTTNNVTTLLNQQNLIYKAFDMIEEYSFFNNKDNTFEKAILGKTLTIKALDLWVYLGVHDSISNDNKEKHFDILKKHIRDFDGLVMSSETINVMSTIIHNPAQNDFINFCLDFCDRKELINITFNNHYHTKASWILNVTRYLIDDQRSHLLSVNEKQTIINCLLSNKILDSAYFKDYIHQTDVFINKLKSLTSSEQFDDFNLVMTKNLIISDLGKTNTTDFIYSHLHNRTIDNSKLLIKALQQTTATDEQKNKIYSLYDFSDIDTVKNIVSQIDRNSSTTKLAMMQNFFTCSEDIIKKEILSHILSLDSAYMPLCKAAYLKIKISENLPEKTNTSAIKRQKL